jgi:hypothetical protein
VPQRWFIAPELWRFGLRQLGLMRDGGGRGDAKTAASEIVGVDERCSRGVSSTVAMPPGVAGAMLASRWLSKQRRHRVCNEHDVQVARSMGGARMV